MKNFKEKFERAMMAAAFAEEGEHDTARELLREDKRKDARAQKREQPRPTMRASEPPRR